MRVLLRSAALAVVAILVISCGGTGAAPGGAKPLTPITFAFVGSAVDPLAANFTVGLEQGYYAAEGLGPVQFVTLSDFAAQGVALESGRVQFAVGAPSFQLGQAAKQKPVPGVNYFAYTYPFKYAWVVRPDSDITDVKQLVGKTVGVDDLGKIAAVMAKALLPAAGVDLSRVTLTATGGGVAGGIALGKGSINAMLADDTTRGQWDVAGIKYRELPLPAEVPLVGTFYIQATPATLKDRPDLAIGFARAVAKGSIFAAANLECAAAIFLKNFPQAAPAGISSEQAIKNIATIVSKRAPLWLPTSIGQTKLGITSPAQWAAEAKYQKIANGEALSKALYTNEYIDRINQFDAAAVTKQAKSCQPASIYKGTK